MLLTLGYLTTEAQGRCSWASRNICLSPSHLVFPLPGALIPHPDLARTPHCTPVLLSRPFIPGPDTQDVFTPLLFHSTPAPSPELSGGTVGRVDFFFPFLRHYLTIWHWLMWNSLCRPEWPQTYKSCDTCLSPLSAGIKGVGSST